MNWAEAAKTVHDDWMRAGRLSLPPDDASADNDLAFWDAVEQLVHGGVQEGLFDELLHPRDRRGEFADKPGQWRPWKWGAKYHPATVDLPSGTAAFLEGDSVRVADATALRTETLYIPAESEIRAAAERLAAMPRQVEGAVVDPQRIRAAFEGFTHDGLTAHVMQVERHDEAKEGDGTTHVAIAVADVSGQQVGYALRRFIKREGELVAIHDVAIMAPSARGRGFMSALNDHVEPHYRELGVKRITLMADAVGSYAWAREGFEPTLLGLARLSSQRGSPSYLEYYPEETRREFEALLPSLDYREKPARVVVPPGGLTSIADVARYGVEQALLGHWIGKDFLIGRSWHGSKSL